MRLEPEEAELAKLFTNTWRYIKFAAANQFWMMANDFGLDFDRIRHAITLRVPARRRHAGRRASPPARACSRTPCSWPRSTTTTSCSATRAMLINEGLPLYLVSRLEGRYDLSTMTVGILGMAFKGGSDDTRESLAYKLRKILMLKAKETLCTDPYVADDRFLPAGRGAGPSRPARHRRTAPAVPRPDRPSKPVADIWGITGTGRRVCR